MKKLLFLCVFFCSILVPRIQANPEKEKHTTDAESMRMQFVAQCKTYLGTPYKYGGLTKDGFDCSGFIYITAKEALDMELPRRSEDLYLSSTKIDYSDLQPGDFLFFKAAERINHAAVYIGNDEFIHAASDGPRTGVIISSLEESYWKKTYVGCGRILPEITTIAEVPIEGDFIPITTSTETAGVIRSEIEDTAVTDGSSNDIEITEQEEHTAHSDFTRIEVNAVAQNITEPDDADTTTETTETSEPDETSDDTEIAEQEERTEHSDFSQIEVNTVAQNITELDDAGTTEETSETTEPEETSDDTKNAEQEECAAHSDFSRIEENAVAQSSAELDDADTTTEPDETFDNTEIGEYTEITEQEAEFSEIIEVAENTKSTPQKEQTVTNEYSATHVEAAFQIYSTAENADEEQLLNVTIYTDEVLN